MQNPLLINSPHPFSAIPFDAIRTEHYLPAIKTGIELAKNNIEKIKAQTETPNFQNTIVALETCSEALDIALNTYHVLYSAEASKEHQILAAEVAQLSSAFSSDISLDKELFKKIEHVYNTTDKNKLTQEQKQLLDKTYKSFSRNGALLKDTDKETLRNIDMQLATLTPKFSENVLNATNSFEVFVEEQRTKGLPENAKEAAKEYAEKKGHPGLYGFNLQGPSFVSAMQSLDDASLREEIYFGYMKKNFGGPHDNSQLVLDIVKLRDQRAKLLGCVNHADYVLQERMAQNPDKVMSFLEKLLEHSKPAAQREVKELESLKLQSGSNQILKPWDVRYFEEKLKKLKYDFDQEELRPYFELTKVYQGAFDLVEKLYDVQFREVKNVPVYHSDVKVVEVVDKESQKHIGLLYMDFFPRETKRSGAWMTEIIGQGLFSGEVKRPHIGIVMNFTPPTKTKPSLLNFDEVLTFFHEFGHALHGLLSKCTYRSLAGTNVYWDFVELPSQFMENWILEKQVLDLFAKHYETGETLPTELFNKLEASKKFMAGYQSVRQLSFGLLDMAWHTSKIDEIHDIDSFETKALESTQLLERIHGTNTSTGFSHVFAGGYSAGYYSYKWAEVLDADAFDYFKEHGLFNKAVAKKFKENILEKGGTEHPMELYKKFRGREPDSEALLKRDGLLVGGAR